MTGPKADGVRQLFWMRTSEAWPDSSWLPTSFTLFDEHKPHRHGDGQWNTYIAGVHQVDAGPQAETWS